MVSYGVTKDFAATQMHCSKQGTSAQLFPWNIHLQRAGWPNCPAAADLAQQLSDKLEPLYDTLSGSQAAAQLMYNARFPAEQYQSLMLRKLESDQSLDIARGYTGTGPHREDFTVMFGDKPAGHNRQPRRNAHAGFGTQNHRTELLEEAAANGRCSLDDVFSELDGARRHALTSYLAPYQTFITTTDADLVQKAFAAAARVLPLG